jgi:hypothetical protein
MYPVTSILTVKRNLVQIKQMLNFKYMLPCGLISFYPPSDFVRLINPIVVSSTIVAVGLSFFSYGFTQVGACLEIGILQLLLVFIFSLVSVVLMLQTSDLLIYLLISSLYDFIQLCITYCCSIFGR